MVLFGAIFLGYFIIYDNPNSEKTLKRPYLSKWLLKFHIAALAIFWTNTWLYYHQHFDLRGVLVEQTLFLLTFFSGFFASAFAVLKNQPIPVNLYFRLFRSFPIIALALLFVPFIGILFWAACWNALFPQTNRLYSDEECRIQNQYQGPLGTAYPDLEVFIYQGLRESKYTFPINIAIYDREKIEVEHPIENEFLIKIYHPKTLEEDLSKSPPILIIDTILISGDKTICTCCSEI